jgi:cytochrome c-type biogenesis protein CcmF
MAVSLEPIHYTGFLPAASLATLAYALYLLARGRDADKPLKLGLWLVVIGWIIYWIPFVTIDFTLHEVFWNTSPGLPLWMRFAAAWAGGGGSLFLFSLIASLATLYLLRGSPSRSLKMAAASTVVVGLLAAFLNDAFTVLPTKPASGAGLNPLLKSPWLYPHPLTTFTGYALLAVAGSAIMLGERRRGYILFELGWASLTLGILLGGYWSYETFGWGGYWAWDPVETSELMVWLAATLLPHLLVVAPSLGGATAAYMASAVFLAMYVTRTGLSPLHSFAAPSVGALLLLASSMAWLTISLLTFYKNMDVGFREALRSAKSLDTYRVGLLVAALALAAASLFVFATLFVPSLMVAAGKAASVPQMSQGIRYFHPVLYPLLIILLATIPAAFLGSWLGWRGYGALTLSTAIIAAILTYATVKGPLNLAPLSPSRTEAMMAFGLPWAITALASTLTYIALAVGRKLNVRRLLHDRLAGLSLLHFGLALTVIGILLSGTFAFNEQYMRDYHLKPGETIVLPNGYKVSLEGYSYHISKSMVDIYTRYVGRASSYFYGHLALATLAQDLSRAVQAYEQGLKLMRSNATARCIAYLASMEEPIPLHEDYNINAIVRVELVDFKTNNTIVIADREPVKIFIGNGSLRPTIVSDPHTGLPVLFTPLQALNITLTFKRNISAFMPAVLGIHQIIMLQFEKPVTLRAGNITVKLYNVTISSPALWGLAPRDAEEYLLHTRGAKLWGKLAIVDVMAGRISCNSTGEFNVPTQLPIPIAAYLTVKYSHVYSTLMKALRETGLYKLLTNRSAIESLVTSPECAALAASSMACEGYVKAPRLAPETAWLTVHLRVGRGGSYRDVNVKVRFEAYGEIQGIHGLVPKVIHPGLGIDELYIVIEPPLVKSMVYGEDVAYHELLIYYLHEAFKNLTPQERLALAAVMVGGYLKDTIESLMRSGQFAQAQMLLEGSLVDVYMLASKFNPANSTIATEGLEVKVKLVPGVRLVWAGPVVMSLAAVYLAVLGAMVYSRGGRASG